MTKCKSATESVEAASKKAGLHNNHLRERLTFLAQELEKITADLPVWG